MGTPYHIFLLESPHLPIPPAMYLSDPANSYQIAALIGGKTGIRKFPPILFFLHASSWVCSLLVYVYGTG